MRRPQPEFTEPLDGSILRSNRELNLGERLLTPKDAASFLRVSLSWLAKARMRGDGPPYVKVGSSVRYSESALTEWMKSRVRLSTSDH
jgi:predicted DNA-binding transcriptional regulator AlpA